MKIALLFNYPLVDNKAWKQELLTHLQDEGHELLVVFGRKSVLAHAKAYMRRKGTIDIKKRMKPSPEQPPVGKTTKLLTLRKIPCKKVPDVNHVSCVKLLQRWKPDIVITALDHIVRPKLIDSVPLILNAHYGVLPEVKGWNASEWSILTQGRLSVSLHKIDKNMDTGAIYLTRPVELTSQDDLEIMRYKAQQTALECYKEFFRNPQNYFNNPQDNSSGTNYYLMNRYLKEQVLKILANL